MPISSRTHTIHISKIASLPIRGWRSLYNNGYRSACIILSQCKTFMTILAAFDPNNASRYGVKRSDIVEKIGTAKLRFSIDETIGTRGLTVLDYKLDENGDIAKDSFEIEVKVSWLNREEGELIVILGHEVGLHIHTYKSLISQFIQNRITQIQFLEQAALVNKNDHIDVHHKRTKVLEDVFHEAYLQDYNRLLGKNNSVSTGLSFTKKFYEEAFLALKDNYSLYTDYNKCEIDLLNENRFQKTFGNFMSVETNFKYHRCLHDALWDVNGDLIN